MSDRLKVYVAGPITQGDRYHNVQQAITAGRWLVRVGFAPFVPHLDCFMFPGENDLTWEEALEWDLPWVLSSDAIYRLPGESEGADLECRVAAENDIPVFTNGVDLVEWRVEREGIAG